MSNISEMELQNLRHLLLSCDTEICKNKEYSNLASDTQIKQFFEKESNGATTKKQTLLEFLK